eukprot:168739-Karenia_brevis.AAC.1
MLTSAKVGHHRASPKSLPIIAANVCPSMGGVATCTQDLYGSIIDGELPNLCKQNVYFHRMWCKMVPE